jgi:hypothetical protein
MTSPESDSPEAIVTDVELTFGETARARSEAILLKLGKPLERTDGKTSLTYTWQVGYHYQKKFTLARPKTELVDAGTAYSLTTEELDRSMGRGGRYDFSQAGLLPSTTFTITPYDELAARQQSITPLEVQHKVVLDYLATVSLEDEGF